ncbi:MAG: hydrogenase nickel incorporation protein HypB [Deltaproteobacteria bacterium]|jgi:hydrogenase nickel incorporation protein HypB|nr:hydrogenase nickel incorporation protein HypB [Deltaproteobacteria bacterium]
MCTDCGCLSSTAKHLSTQTDEPRKIQIEESLLAKNSRLAQVNRARFLAHHLLVLNMMSSPGSGKTSLLERTLAEQKQHFAFAVVEGDQQTENDARRIAATGVPVKQINTGSGCHLDAHMISHSVDHFNLESTDILIIENVGNLVCPASFDLGEDHKVVLLSVTEGEDKPLKYPQMFQAASLMLINKIDLLPYLQFDLEQCKSFARRVNPAIEMIELSCQSGLGLDQWYQWLGDKLAHKQ